jgi:hypothetical protein
MARKLPDHVRHTGSINYRAAVIGRQLESLRLALVGFTTSGQDGEAKRCLRAIRDQLDLLEADMPEIAKDQAAWRAQCDARHADSREAAGGDRWTVP